MQAVLANAIQGVFWIAFGAAALGLLVTTLAPAGPMSRALAWAIDLALRLMLWGSSVQLLVIFGEAGLGLILLAVRRK